MFSKENDAFVARLFKQPEIEIHNFKPFNKRSRKDILQGAVLKAALPIFSAIGLLVSTTVNAQIPELEGLDAFMQKAMAFEKTPGAAIAVVRGGEQIYSKGFGIREAGKSGAVDGDTIFAIGSVSKYFTANALGLMVAEGKLNWDDPLTKFLPALRFSDPYLQSNATIRDALSHRVGVVRNDIYWSVNPGISRRDVIAMIEHLPKGMGFRSGLLYNNYLYVAAGEVIPTVSGQSWDQIIRERFFAPLNMTRSSTTIDGLDDLENVATPHSVVEGKASPRPYYNADHVGPAGSINSSVNDMAQWCKLQLANGKWGGEQLIPETVIKEVRKPHALTPLKKDGLLGTRYSAYGLGITRKNYGPYLRYQHAGGVTGMLSNFVFIPEEDLCVVTLTNNDSSYGLYTLIADWVVDHMLQLPEKNRDYLAPLKKRAELSKNRKIERKSAHEAAANAAIKPTMPLEAYVGTYVDSYRGSIKVTLREDKLQFSYGSVHSGTLVHHRGDSFDLSASGHQIPMNLTFSNDASRAVDSVLVRMGYGQSVRFLAQREQ